jgi:hypothetical protein
MARFTHATTSTRNVERDRDEITYFDELNVAPCFDDFSGDFMSERLAYGRGGSATDHVLVTAANVCGYNSKNNPVITFAVLGWQL